MLVKAGKDVLVILHPISFANAGCNHPKMWSHSSIVMDIIEELVR
jgi:hypothetical protein